MTRRRAGGVAAIALAIVAVAVVRCRGGATSKTGASGAADRQPGATGLPLSSSHRSANGARIAGTVFLDGSAVPGATVRIASATGDVGKPVTTDAAGHFDLGVLPARRYVVIAEKAQASGALVHVDLRDPSQHADELALVLHACTAMIRGTVRDTAGGSIPGARVARSDDASDTADGPATETDAAGNYQLCAVPGELVLVASADGYAQESAALRVSGPLRHDFVLGPEATIAGRVVRASDGAPVPGADLALRADELGDPTRVFRATSDDDGRFRFTGVAPGRYLIAAAAGELVTAQAVPIQADLGAAPDDILCELGPAATVRGRVVEGGKPVPRAHVVLHAQTTTTVLDLDATSDDDGRFAIEHVVPGAYTAQAEGYLERVTRRFVVDARGVDDLQLDVETLASISGRVTSGGKPAEGVPVTDGHVRAVTGIDGRYTLRGVAEGAAEIYAESKRIGAFGHVTLTVSRGQDRTGVDIALDLSGSIAGTVVDQDGKPVSGAHLGFSLVQGRDYGDATTGEDGSFIATTLSGGGDYALEIEAALGSTTRYPPASGATFPRIHVADATTHVTGVRIAVQRVRRSIAGHVVGAHGEPLPDVTVVASFSAYGPGPTTRTDDTGAFALTDLPETRVYLRATSARGGASLDDILPGQQNLVLHIADAGTVTGTLHGFRSAPEVFATRNDVPTALFHAVVHGTHFTLRGLSRGRYWVTARSATEFAEGHLEVDGGDVTMTLEATGTGTIAGTVRDAATHQPIAGMICGASDATADSTTGPDGTYRIDGVVEGTVSVYCSGRAGSTSGRVSITAGQTVTEDLEVMTRASRRRSHAGFDVVQDIDAIVVKSIEPGGPAARAGLRLGDTMVLVDGGRFYGSVEVLEYAAPGTQVPIEIERDGKRQTLTLTLTPPPP